MMRPLRLARVAAEAEGLRWRRMTQRIVIRVVFAFVALVFLLGTLAFVHVAVWYWLRIGVGLTQIWTAVTVGGGDLVIAVVLAVLATRSSPGRVEQEALEVRRRALTNMQSNLALSAMLMPLLRMAWRRRRRRR